MSDVSRIEVREGDATQAFEITRGLFAEFDRHDHLLAVRRAEGPVTFDDLLDVINSVNAPNVRREPAKELGDE